MMTSSRNGPGFLVVVSAGLSLLAVTAAMAAPSKKPSKPVPIERWLAADGHGVVAGEPEGAEVTVQISGPKSDDYTESTALARALRDQVVDVVRESLGKEPAFGKWTEGWRPGYDPQHGTFPGAPRMGTVETKLSFADIDKADELARLVQGRFTHHGFTQGWVALRVTYNASPVRPEIAEARRKALEDAHRRATSYAAEKGVTLVGEGLPGSFSEGALRTEAGWVIEARVNVIWRVEPLSKDEPDAGQPSSNR